MFCIPRVVTVRNGHICFEAHPNIQKQYTKKIASVQEASAAGYRICIDINEGEQIDIGGYIVSRNGGKVCTDRTEVFQNHTDIRTKFSSPEIRGKIHLDIYVDPNLIEIYINNGTYVITNVVYQLGEYMTANTENTPVLYTIE